MNEFEFRIKAEEIKESTLKSYLTKTMSTHYSKANPYYKAHYDLYTIDHNSDLTTLEEMLLHKKLATLARDRYVELYPRNWQSKLPVYVINLNCTINAVMNLEQSIAWLKYIKESP